MNARTYRSILVAFALALTPGVATAQEAEKGNFHHIHLNVVDAEKTIDFYKKFFDAVPINYRGASPALLIDRSFLLLKEVGAAAPWPLVSAIYHIGWGGVNGPADFEWRDDAGVEWETPLTPLGTNWYMYAFGPDKEVVEVWTGFKHHRFGHVHLIAEDVNATKNWYKKYLNINGPERDTPKPPKAPGDFELDGSNPSVFQYLWASQVSTDNGVTINIFGKPSDESVVWWQYGSLDDIEPSDGRVVDHIAFSYRDIQPVYDRMKAGGVEIVDDIKERPEYKLRSFFVRGPDNILIEIVQARPLPEGVWE